MKRKLFPLLMLFVSIPFLNGCSNCTHNFENRVVTKAPTENSKGTVSYTCSLCGKTKTESIPKLSTSNYTLRNVEADCCTAGGREYSNEKYGTYLVELTPKLDHSTDMGRCDYCGNLVNQMEFKRDEWLKPAGFSGGYPRVYVLRNGNWLIGADSGGSVNVALYTANLEEKLGGSRVSFRNNATCANVDFFEVEDDVIICSYRAVGPGYQRGIYCSISRDGGYNWEEYGTIVDNYEMDWTKSQVDARMRAAGKYNVGFYEPFVDLIGDKITVVYADDFSPMMEQVYPDVDSCYQCQYLVMQELDYSTGEWGERKIVMDGSDPKKPAGSDCLLITSRDGMPVYTTLHDGTVVMVFEGTYRRNIENQEVQFEILLSYSKDKGKTWSRPVECFVPKGYKTKASAPFIITLPDDRIVVSFQTNEDCYGTEVDYFGANQDPKSIMKCIISDGTDITKLTKDHFLPAVNVFNNTPGQGSLWNGMHLIDNRICCISGYAGITLAFSDIPLLEKK